MLQSAVDKLFAARPAAVLLAAVGGLTLLLWAAGVGRSPTGPLPAAPHPSGSQRKTAQVCRHFPQAASDERRCRQLALAPAPSAMPPASAPSFQTAAREGMYELIGWHPAWRGGRGYFNTNGKNIVSLNYKSGLWGGAELSHWWQSAMALRTVVRYAERIGSTARIYQQVLERTYRREVHHPIAFASDHFVNAFGDDTAWWGLAWLEASNYELHYLRDLSAAHTFLWTAEHDASYLEKLKKSCGGIVWMIGNPTDTVTNAEFVSLAAELYAYRHAPGPFHDESRARMWLQDARADLNWLEHSGLVNMKRGRVSDRLTRSCRPAAGPLTYTEGETAEALIQMGNALHQRSYYRQAARFLDFATTRRKSNMVTSNGVMQEPCESTRSLCVPVRQRGRLSGTPTETWEDQLSYKGVLAETLDDYVVATGSKRYANFLHRQGTAIVSNAIRNPKRRPGDCGTPSSCQFVFYWAWPLNPVRPMIVNTATQMSALDVLTAVVPRRSAGPPAAG